MSDTPEVEETEVEVGPDDNIEVSPASQQQQAVEEAGLDAVTSSEDDE
jgi:hypothetical protein